MEPVGRGLRCCPCTPGAAMPHAARRLYVPDIVLLWYTDLTVSAFDNTANPLVSMSRALLVHASEDRVKGVSTRRKCSCSCPSLAFA